MQDPLDCPSRGLTRARFLRSALGLCAAALGATSGGVLAQGARMQQRKIPQSGEMLPVIGCGTWQTFDIGDDPAERAQRAAVLAALLEAGGSVIDSSPMYGRAEAVVGDLLAAAAERPRAFVATKVWTSGRGAGIEQMERSMALLRTDRIDLMQVHNLLDWRTHLQTLKDWKEQGRVRYVGVTHYTSGAHADIEHVMRSERLDFVQINYALDDRAVEKRVLPLAHERGVAVIVNQPFGGGGLLRRLRDRRLPRWAAEIGCTSWAQVLLKFVLAHPAVTCVIPGTSRAEHMRDNAAAGLGSYPDARLRMRMIKELGA
jgi:aryl-alcohol dehydrogenase-like predicted oxidoreductase